MNGKKAKRLRKSRADQNIVRGFTKQEAIDQAALVASTWPVKEGDVAGIAYLGESAAGHEMRIFTYNPKELTAETIRERVKHLGVRVREIAV
jgi:hypothetical protein